MRTHASLLVALTLGVTPAFAAQAPAGAPVGQYTAVDALPGMGRAVDTAAVAARRRALARAMGRGVALVPAARPRDLERDYLQDNDFRQANTFFYFTGLETASAWLLVTAPGGDTVDVALFLPPRTPAAERWTGRRLGPDSGAARLSGIARVLPLDSLDGALAAAMQRLAPAPLYLPLDGTTRDEERIEGFVFAEGRPRDVRNLRPIVDSLRMVKDADEIARLRRAIDITVAGHLAAARALRPGVWEYQLEATLEQAFRWHGADRVGFPSIVGSGPNSTTLHYDVNRRQMRDGDLVVVDIGAEWGQYTADVTRTLPVSGRFTPRQRRLYELVLGAQRAAFAAVKPGVTLRDLHRIAVQYLKEHSDGLCGEQTCETYFIHGLGHHLGMDVHDVTVAGRAVLEPGMVFTIEPGVYLPDEGLGVRIEDDVLVTATGAVWLSDGAPRDPDAIERLMRRR